MGDFSVPKFWNSPLKNGGSSNLAVNGSSPSVEFSYSPGGANDAVILSMCLIAEFTGSIAIGNKFLADALATLTNGLLIEGKADDVTFSFGNLKRTRDVIEVSQPQGGLNIITGTTSLLQTFFVIPDRLKLCKAGSFSTGDFIKATVRDDLRALTYLEVFLQGVKT